MVSATTPVGVPSDYDELARLYGDDILRVVRSRVPWLRPWDLEDAGQYILQQFLINDVIAQYRPELATERVRDPFRAFILAKVPAYCKGIAERVARNGSRELAIADAPAGDGSSTLIEVLTGAGPGTGDQGDESYLERLRAHLRDCPPEPGQVGLLRFFDVMAARLDCGKPVTEYALGRRFRIGTAEAGEYLVRLRTELRAAVSSTRAWARYDLGPVSLTAAELRSAIDLIRALPGNRVLPAWEKAGHPLAAYGKTWYLAPAKAELARYPELRGSKGGHYPGGHGSPVKRGLIHWLERVLAGGELPAAPARDEAGALEQALAVLPGATPELVSGAMTAIEAMFRGPA